MSMVFHFINMYTSNLHKEDKRWRSVFFVCAGSFISVLQRHYYSNKKTCNVNIATFPRYFKYLMCVVSMIEYCVAPCQQSVFLWCYLRICRCVNGNSECYCDGGWRRETHSMPKKCNFVSKQTISITLLWVCAEEWTYVSKTLHTCVFASLRNTPLKRESAVWFPW